MKSIQNILCYYKLFSNILLREDVLAMMILLVNWFLSALSLIIVAHVVPGFEIKGFGTALIAAIVIGLVNATIGLILKIVTFPVTILTFGLFLFVINALMLRFATLFVS